MSTEILSRGAVQTFAELIEAIIRRTDLPPRRRQDLVSALRRFCRYQHREPAEVNAEPTSVRRELAQMSPMGTGLSRGSFRNLKSLVGQALLMAGIATVRRRSRILPSPAWRLIIEAVDDRHRRYSMSHFSRHLTARGVEPTDVDDDVMGRYRDEVISKSLLTRPGQAAREAVLTWNLVRGTAAGRDLRELTVPDNRRRYALPLDSFPSSFREDLSACLASLRDDEVFPDDPFDERGRSAASPDTIASWCKQILAIASALVETGRDPHSIRSLADLVDPEAAKAALTVVWRRLGQRQTGYLHNLALRLVNLGRHWVDLPPKDLERLCTVRRRLDPGKGGMTENNRRKLLQFADPINVKRLLELPQRLMNEAVRRDRGGVSEVVLAQSAATIAIELVAMLRIRTLVSLTEAHILRSRPGRRAIVHLVIPGGITKNRKPLELALPPWVVELVDLYWHRFRPRLLSQPDPWLFPGRNGPKDRGGMSKQISKAILTQAGLRMHGIYSGISPGSCT